jgi:lysophospholipase L1-like esterase
MTFDYPNLSERPAGRFVSLGGLLLPGIRQVQHQVRPYAAFWRRSNAEAMAGSGPLWVALGDSLTQGIGASAPDRGWVGQLAARLAEAGRPMRVVNLAVTGARVEDVRSRQLPALRGLGMQPDLVTLLIGSNDLMSPRHRRDLPAGFELLLEQLPAGTVVANLPNPTATADAVNRSLHRAAGRRRLVIADMRGSRTTSWRGKLAADHFHPNDRGYSDIAAVFADSIRLPSAPGGRGTEEVSADR